MSELVTALDNHTSIQLGENGFSEYKWSASIREKICQLSFQLTRTDSTEQLTILENKYEELILEILNSTISEERTVLLSYVYRMVGQTRDIIDGKGEYSLSYMLINVWSKVDNSKYIHLAKFALQQFVKDSDGKHPYGSWKDLKYFYSQYPLSPLIPFIVSLMNDQLRSDVISDNPSLLAKWIPREKTGYKYLYNMLATNYFIEYYLTANSETSRQKAILKSKMDYRKIISSINKKLDTTQIKQCSNNWSEIKPNNVTSITMTKQKRAFLNIKSSGEMRYDNEDRITCANNFKEFIEKAKNGETQVKGKRVGLNDFVKNVLSCGKLTDDEKDLINAQWVNNSSQTGALGKMIAMVDVSGSMAGDPLHAAIGLGLRIAEKSMLGKRVLTFSASPRWVNLSHIDNFVDMVKIVSRADWGMNTNFTAALNLILDAITANKLNSEDVEDMVLVILSDMQMDKADDGTYNNLMRYIEEKYADAGMNICGKPYKPPHILFWNLRSTSGFPTLSNNKNCSMMSGFSPALLNLFCDEGINALHSCNPWNLLTKSLDNERYKKMDIYLRETCKNM